MHLVYPLKNLNTPLPSISFGTTVDAEELETMHMQNFFFGGGGVKKVHYGLKGTILSKRKRETLDL